MYERASIKSILRLFWGFTARHPVLLLLVFGGACLVHLTEIILPLYFKKLLDIVAGADVATPNVIESLLAILITISLLGLFGWFWRRISHVALTYSEARGMADLSTAAFSYMIGHSYDFFVHNFAGSLVRRVGRLARSYEEFYDQVFFHLFPLTISMVGILIVLFNRHVFLGAALSIWLALFLTAEYLVTRWKQKYNERKSAKDTEQTGVLADIITNETNVKLFSGRRAEAARFSKVTEELRGASVLSWNIDEAIRGVTGLLMLVIQFVLFFAAIKLWQRGVLTIGDFALIQAYLLVLFERLWNLGSTMRRMFEAFADAAETVAIMEKPYEVADKPRASTLVVKEGAIVFRNVTFNFKKTRRVLDGYSLSVLPREKIALVGPSGAGKSTVIKLLLRFYDIGSGMISIDGQNIAHVTQESLRDAIAVVPQDPILFHRTLMDNIRYGRRDATDTEVFEAARLAHCTEFIEKFPEGYQTYVGERGVRLSGGERQRIAIARALLKNAPILILDEATSSLDSESERLIQEALATLMKGKTTIVIAHRLSTIRSMDRIVVMEKGRVATSGTHDELIRAGGLYAELWNIQAGGFVGVGEEEETFAAPRLEDEAERKDISPSISDDKTPSFGPKKRGSAA